MTTSIACGLEIVDLDLPHCLRETHVLISVIIPTLNRSRLLNRTLFTLYEQVSGNDFEIIVVDNGSSDNTREVVERYSEKIKNRLVYIFDDRPGLLVGRNRGAREAKGNILSFIDDDVIVTPYWIDGIVKVFENEQVSLATGNNYPFFESAVPEWLCHMWRRYGATGKYLYELSLLDLGAKNTFINPVLVWGLNYHIRKEVYFTVGGFNPDILPKDFIYFIGNGETGIAHNIVENGYKAFFDPRLSLYHTVISERLTKEYFLQRSYIEGMMNGYTIIRNGVDKQDKSKLWKIMRWPVLTTRDIVRSIGHRRKRLGDSELYKFEKEIKVSLAKGFEDYIKHVKGNSLLMKYVKEDNYLDIDTIAFKYYHSK
jgi:glycosyltransferase involved in cell wall biosynthesis